MLDKGLESSGGLAMNVVWQVATPIRLNECSRMPVGGKFCTGNSPGSFRQLCSGNFFGSSSGIAGSVRKVAVIQTKKLTGLTDLASCVSGVDCS